MNKDTVKRALKFLVQQGLISKQSKCGRASTYRANLRSEWKPLLGGIQGLAESEGQAEKGAKQMRGWGRVELGATPRPVEGLLR